MHNKKLFSTAATLFVFTIVIALIQALGVPLKEVIAGIIICALYTLLVASYILRIALVFIGVFALYRMLQVRHYKQIAV